MLNKMKFGVFVILLALVWSSVSIAEDIMPFADSVFTSVTADFGNDKSVLFSCKTFDKQGSIKITSCWLQVKENDTWKYSKSLSAPTKEAENTIVYTSYMDYSTSIGAGTFRIGFIVNGDGHAITRYSNERTFK